LIVDSVMTLRRAVRRPSRRLTYMLRILHLSCT